MAFTTRKQANEFYADYLFDAQVRNCVPEVSAILGRKDLFFLLTKLLHRKDADRDWLFERCQEVQAEPNNVIDLWAREHYKSTIITFAKSIQDIIDSHSKDSYYWSQEVTIGIFSHTRPIAKAFMNQIKVELEGNETLKELYPDVLYANPKTESPRWSLDNGIVVKRKGNPNAATVEAWGLVDGQPTSKHFLVLNYDDVVTKESVTTPEQIKKVTESLRLSFNLGAEGGVKRYIGTRYHFNDTYGQLIKESVAKTRIYPATHDGTVTGRPVFLTEESLATKRKEQGPYVFSCQQLQNPIADEAQGFVMEWVQNKWYPKKEHYDKMNVYIVVDPASSKKKGSDYTVMWVIGLNSDRCYYLIDGIRDRLNLAERTQTLFSLHRKYAPVGVGYEKYGKDSDIEHIEGEMIRENYRFDIIEMGGAISKPERIKGIVPAFSQGKVYLPHRLLFKMKDGTIIDLTRYLIEEELLPFPVAQFDDGADCLARIKDKSLNAQFPEVEITDPSAAVAVFSAEEPPLFS